MSAPGSAVRHGSMRTRGSPTRSPSTRARRTRPGACPQHPDRISARARRLHTHLRHTACRCDAWF
eukprot:3729914-Rhodomonas_salina.2